MGALLLIVLVIAAWEFLPRIIAFPRAFVTTPSAAVGAIAEEPARFTDALSATLAEFGPAFLISAGGGVLIGLLLGSFPQLQFGRSYLAVLYAVPLVMIYPLLTAWLGLDSMTRIVFGGLYGIIPTALTTAASVATMDRTWIETARSMGAKPMTVVCRVVVPLTLPGIFAALRVGGGLTFVAVIIGQLLASNRGLGFILTTARTRFEVDALYAAVIIVMLLALAINVVLYAIERTLSPWPKGTLKGAG